MRNRVLSVLLALAAYVILTAAPTAAQVTPKPTAASRGGMVAKLRPAGPDLVVSVSQSGKNVPTSYTVRNIGAADAGPSILKVAATLTPLDPSLIMQDLFKNLSVMQGLEKGCQPPLEDFVELIQGLPSGGSKTVAPTGFFKTLKSVSFASKLAPPKPNYSYVEDCSPRLVCVFELKVTVDDGNDVAETNEHNNQIVRAVERKVAMTPE